MRNFILTLSAIAAVLGSAVAAGAGPTITKTNISMTPAEAQALVEEAVGACEYYQGRLETEGDEDRFLTFMAQGCAAVLNDLASDDAPGEQTQFYGVQYLSSLVALHRESTAMQERWEENAHPRVSRSNAGEFLMAKHLHVMTNYNAWYRAQAEESQG